MRRLFLYALLGLSGWMGPMADGAEATPGVSPLDRARIDEACPAKAPATPKRPRRLLIFDRTEGFVHACIPLANEAFRRLGEKTGAYRSTRSDDMAVFTPENLKQYDAILFNNTTQLKFADPAARAALLDFVKGGKGVIGIHAALDNFPTWPEGQALLGGVFHSHPWTAGEVAAIKLDDAGSPLTAAFGGKGFWVRDEIYQVTGAYDRKAVHVLTSLDMSAPENARPANQIVRTDNDFPVSWIRTYGAGRVFYNSLGHRGEDYETAAILAQDLAGIQFALGDLKAEATPSAELSPRPEAKLAPAAAVGSEPILNGGWRSLLDAKLSAWDVWLGAPHHTITGLPAGTPLSADGHVGTPLGLNHDPLHVFTLEMESGEPVVHVSGEILGALESRESFSNYHLRVQVKWGERKWEPKLTVPRDSGLLYHSTGPNGAMWNAWKECLEFQIQEKDMGDLFCLNGTGADVKIKQGPNHWDRWFYDPTAAEQRVSGPGSPTGDVAHLRGDFEKPNGEWNTLDLYAVGADSVQAVNGTVVLRVRNARLLAGPNSAEKPLTGGSLQLQSEGAEVYFRRVEIRPLAAFPPELGMAP